MYVVYLIVAVLCVVEGSLLGAPPQPLIDLLVVTGSKIQVRVNKGFKSRYLTEDFFIEYDKDIDLSRFDYAILTMPFLMNVATIVWISGNEYTVQEIDSELYYSLKRVKKVFKYMYPQTSWKGKIRPLKLVDHPSSVLHAAKDHTALLYSGGLDSFSTAIHHRDKKLLFITAWGHWDLPLEQKSLWYKRKRDIQKVASRMHGELSTVRSNYTSFLRWDYLSSLSSEIRKWRLGAVEGLGWAGIAAPILLAKGYETLHIASSHSWLYTYPSAANPFVDNNLQLAGIRIVHDEFDKSRLQKIEGVARYCEKTRINPFLKICSYEKRNDRNCGVCRKCVTTAIGFYGCGADPQKFGIMVKPEVAIKRAVDLLAPRKQAMYTLLYFNELQDKLLSDKSLPLWHQGLLRPLLTIDLTKKYPWDVALQRVLNWHEMSRFLPELTIPSTV